MFRTSRVTYCRLEGAGGLDRHGEREARAHARRTIRIVWTRLRVRAHCVPEDLEFHQALTRVCLNANAGTGANAMNDAWSDIRRDAISNETACV